MEMTKKIYLKTFKKCPGSLCFTLLILYLTAEENMILYYIVLCCIQIFCGAGCDAAIGQHPQASYTPIQTFFQFFFSQKCVKKILFFITFFLHSNVNALIKLVAVISNILAVMENVFQVCMFKNRINLIKKLLPNV